MDVARDDVGVSMAPASSFTPPSTAGVLLTVTDASHAADDDGVGGFAFWADDPGTVFILSEPWPPLLKAALAQAATKRTSRAADGPAVPALSMPAGEVTASVALATAVAARHHVEATIAITDCAPAAVAFTSLCSRSAQIHSLLGFARSFCPRWLGVHIPREWNTDADRLSHPSLAAMVIADAVAAGLNVQRVCFPSLAVEAATRASHLPLRHADRSERQ